MQHLDLINDINNKLTASELLILEQIVQGPLKLNEITGFDYIILSRFLDGLSALGALTIIPDRGANYYKITTKGWEYLMNDEIKRLDEYVIKHIAETRSWQGCILNLNDVESRLHIQSMKNRGLLKVGDDGYVQDITKKSWEIIKHSY